MLALDKNIPIRQITAEPKGMGYGNMKGFNSKGE
jgi:hypothetical protein